MLVIVCVCWFGCLLQIWVGFAWYRLSICLTMVLILICLRVCDVLDFVCKCLVIVCYLFRFAFSVWFCDWILLLVLKRFDCLGWLLRTFFVFAFTLCVWVYCRCFAKWCWWFCLFYGLDEGVLLVWLLILFYAWYGRFAV